jgi:hypothetical protein
MRPVLLSVTLLLICSICSPAEAKKIKNTFEVTAKLVKIPGKMPPDELYDYAFVMKYKVVGGKLDKKEIHVAHYKPRRPRKKITDKMKKFVKGSLKRFREGDMHKMTLAPKIKKVWRGAVVDEFFAADRKSKRYFCLKVDLAKKSGGAGGRMEKK